MRGVSLPADGHWGARRREGYGVGWGGADSGALKSRKPISLWKLCLGEAGTAVCKVSVVYNRLAAQSLSVQGLQKGAFRADAPRTQGLYTQEAGEKEDAELPEACECVTFFSSWPLFALHPLPCFLSSLLF